MGLRRITPNELPSGRRDPVDADTLAAAARIVGDVRDGGEAALRGYAERFGDIAVGAPLVFGPDVLAAARDALPATDRALLERTTVLPREALDGLREVARVFAGQAVAAGARSLFLPRAVQRLLEICAAGDAATARARLQLHLLALTRAVPAA